MKKYFQKTKRTPKEHADILLGMHGIEDALINAKQVYFIATGDASEYWKEVIQTLESYNVDRT